MKLTQERFGLLIYAMMLVFFGWLVWVVVKNTPEEPPKPEVPQTQCELDLIEARDYIGDLEGEVADLERKVETLKVALEWDVKGKR